MHYVLHTLISTILCNNSPHTLSEEPLVIAKHTTQQRPLRCMSCNLHSPKPWLIALVLVLFIVPLKADLQALACSSEYHDNGLSLTPPQDAMSSDYALGTPSSEEC